MVPPEASVALHKTAPSPALSLPSPLSLTAPDGTGLTLAALRVRGVVDGPLALTEYHMDFVNTEARTIEGRFEITLPPGAQISRFAMRVGTTWQEAEVVERKRAQGVYEAILHQGLDPALLEQDAGNRFGARVFPIAAHETKQLIVSYTQELSGDDYTIPLRGLPKLGSLEVQVHQRGAKLGFERVEHNFLAREDLLIPLDGHSAAFVDGELAVVRLVPVPVSTKAGPTHEDQLLDELTILVDTSASRAVNFGAKIDRLQGFCEALRKQIGGDAAVAVVAFDQSSEVVYRGSLAKLGSATFERLAARRALGSTDLVGALERLRAGTGKRLVLTTDGVATTGDAQSPAALAKLLARKGFVRVDVLVDGSLRDQAGLQRLVSEGLPFAGQLVELERESAAAAAGRIRRPTLAPMSVAVEGASWVSTHELRGLQPGDDILVFAQLEQPTKALKISLGEHGGGTRELSLKAAPIDRALLERSVVGHRVHEQLARLELEATSDPRQAALLAREITDLATQHRVLTPYTAMLVLENQAAYDRFGLRRETLAPILGIEAGSVTLQHGRDELASLGPSPTPKPEPETTVTQTETTVTQIRVAESELSSHRIGELELEEAKQLPVGSNTTRDFTAVVDLAPAAARDAAGVSLGAVGADVISRSVRRAPRPLPDAKVNGRRLRSSSNYDDGALRLASADLDQVVRRCYDLSLVMDGRWSGRATLRIDAQATGSITQVWLSGASDQPHFDACLATHVPAQIGLPSTTDAQMGSIERRYVFHAGVPLSDGPVTLAERPTGDNRLGGATSVSGRYAEVLSLLDAGRYAEALELATIWHELFPGDPLALLGLGKALAAHGELDDATRAYGGLADLHPARADIRRFAGNLLESLPEPALAIAIDNYRHAIEARPDQPSSYRMLALALARNGDFDSALSTLEDVLERGLAQGRYAGVHDLLRRDLELLGAVWIVRDPKRRADVLRRLIAVGGALESGPSTRFVLTWETDANDVDLHVYDRLGRHAYYEHPELVSGGRLLADVTTGFGPEGFLIPQPDAFPYSLAVHYFNQGSSGHGMGQVQIVSHDGHGQLSVENRPFVLMSERAELDLGEVLASR